MLTVNPIDVDLKAIELNDFGDCPSIRGIIFISGPKHQTNKNQVHIFFSCHTYTIIHFYDKPMSP